MKSTATFMRLKETLTKRRDALLRVLQRDLSGLRTGVGLDTGDTVDQALDDEFNHLSSQLAQSESRELAQIEEALRRMKKGEYGLCEGCGGTIPLARLQALPYAKRCVKCQRVSERVESGPAARIDWSAISDLNTDDTPELSIDEVMDVG